MKSTREPGNVAEIHGSAQIIQACTQLLRTHIPQGAPGKGVVKAQALQILRRKEYIHDGSGVQDFINVFGYDYFSRILRQVLRSGGCRSPTRPTPESLY